MQLRSACRLVCASLIGGIAACSAGGENTPESVLVGGAAGAAGAESSAAVDAGDPNPDAVGGAGSMFSGSAGAGAVGPGASAPRDAGLSPTETPSVSDAGDAGASAGADASLSPELVAQLARLSALSAPRCIP